MKKTPKRLVLLAIALGLLAPYLLMIGGMVAGRLYGWVNAKVYADKAVFSSEKWKDGNRKTRFTYVDALLAEDVLKDKSQSEVRLMLGAPDRIADGQIWVYETKRPGWRFIDFSGGGVAVEFDDNQHVKTVTDTRWVD